MSTIEKVTKRKRTGAHFTPPELASLIAQRMVDAIEIERQFRVLDPACGEGELLAALWGAAPKELRDGIQLLGVEADKKYLRKTAERLSGLSCPAMLIHGDFLEMALHFRERSLLWTENLLPL